MESSDVKYQSLYSVAQKAAYDVLLKNPKGADDAECAAYVAVRAQLKLPVSV